MKDIFAPRYPWNHIESDYRKNITAKNGELCEWCGGFVESEGHDCYYPQSKKQYLYRNRKRLSKKL